MGGKGLWLSWGAGRAGGKVLFFPFDGGRDLGGTRQRRRGSEWFCGAMLRCSRGPGLASLARSLAIKAKRVNLLACERASEDSD